MEHSIALRRLELAQRLRLPTGSPVLSLNQLRFSLGVSATDLRVPFEIAGDVAQLVERAALQLGWMIAVRHQLWLTEDERDALLLGDTPSELPPLSPALTPAAGNPDARAAADLAPALHPALTSGVLSTWMGQGGGGRSLVALTTELLRRAFGEMQVSGKQEETPAWVVLMLLSLFSRTHDGLRQAGYPRSIASPLYGAVGTGVFLAVRLGLELAARGVVWPPGLLDRTEAALSPRIVLGDDAASWSHNALYGCALTMPIPDAERWAQALGQGSTAWSTDFIKALEKDGSRAHQAEEAVAHAGVRARILAGARALEGGGHHAPEVGLLLTRLAVAPGALVNLLGEDERERRELARALADVELPQGSPPDVLKSLASLLKSFSPKKPAKCLDLSHRGALERYAQAAAGYFADVWLERLFQPIRQRLVRRTGQEAEGGQIAEYETGQLYLLNLSAGPLLKARVDLEQGHLFVNVKDFTRRTALLGQSAMADFLRREFYLPILSAAKRHYGGLSHLADKGGISINNLLGDAVSLSGQIEGLVSVATAIRRHLIEYDKRLSRELATRVVTAAVKKVEEEFARRPRTPEWAAEREAALARARGEQLEAGVFVSHGPAPLVITIEDEVFGVSKVAIADRINESARGTARANSARAQLDVLLTEERRRRSHPGLKHAWSVFVGAPLLSPLSGEVERRAHEALGKGLLDDAAREVEAALRQQLQAWQTKARGEPTGDIYNAGAALSEEALLAFCEAKQNERALRQIVVDPSKLHPDLHTHHFFPPGDVTLIASFHQGRLAELFRFAGRCLFKGLERSGGIAVWELVNESPIFEHLQRHHAVEWRTAGTPFTGTPMS